MTDEPLSAPIQTRPLPADGGTRPLPNDPLPDLSTNRHIAFAQATDVGMVRSNNQDAVVSFFCATRSAEEWPDFGLFSVADGMGGHHDGEKASALALRTLLSELTNTLFTPLITARHQNNDTPTSEILVAAALKANGAVIRMVPDGGTTLTGVMIVGDLAYIAHVGDSRVYLMIGDRVEQVTRDHSLVQRLIELDQLTIAEAADHPQKNVLYRALGQTETLEVDIITRRLTPHSRLLICSDGLWNLVMDRELREIVMKNADPQTACDQLIALANSRGGTDNITVVLIHIPG
jgi:protein phosphatase